MENGHALDNPLWSALHSLHAGVALGRDNVLRYPDDVPPFLGVAHAGVDAGPVLETLIPEHHRVMLLGIAPDTLPSGWILSAFDDLVQMQCVDPLPVNDAPEIIALAHAHRSDVLALTALVYPHYFRARTMELGRYFGLYVDGRLAAMIGERLGAPRFREMSAICTHPDFVGRGYARRLTAMLTNDTLHRGDVPFLHVSHANVRARALYLAMGYRLWRDIAFWSLQRA